MKTIIAGNWKMNLDRPSGVSLAKRLHAAAGELTKTELWIAPPATLLADIRSALGPHSPVMLGGQNVFWEASGAYTGEISAAMLAEAGCSFVLAGHSERRTLFGETDESAAARALGALRGGLTTIFCVGEQLEERLAGDTKTRLREQLGALEKKLLADKIGETLPSLLTQGRFLIAYEPVWAIGTGKVATPSEIHDAHAEILDIWKTGMGLSAPRILYGGSVTPDNFASIIEVDAVDGALVGGASLVHEKFVGIARIAEEYGLSSS